MWLPHVTSGNGLYTHVKIIIIPWEHLEDFVEEEQNNENFPCKFTRTKNYSKSSTPNSLSHPITNYASFIYRWRNVCKIIILHFFWHSIVVQHILKCCNLSNVINTLIPLFPCLGNIWFSHPPSKFDAKYGLCNIFMFYILFLKYRPQYS